MRGVCLMGAMGVVLGGCGESGVIDNGGVETTGDETGVIDSGTIDTAMETSDTATDTETDIETDTETETETDTWEPRPGRYYLTSGQTTVSECGRGFEMPPPGEVLDTRFTFEDETVAIKIEFEDPVECYWSSPLFEDCRIESYSQEPREGVTVKTEIFLTGLWSEAEVMDGSFEVIVECTGDLCDVFATSMGVDSFPCTEAMEYEGVWHKN